MLFAAEAPALAQDPDLGKLEFVAMCAACHGADGKGTGPFADQLKTKPADLTILAKSNNGVFPVTTTYDIIDGRKVIAAHGTRDMPIWGAYRQRMLYPPGKLIDLSYDPEAVVRTRILLVIDYLNRIQER
jgi:mono/diheme cytochrome c family protein